MCQLMSLSAPSTPFGMQWFKDDHQVDPAGEFDKRDACVTLTTRRKSYSASLALKSAIACAPSVRANWSRGLSSFGQVPAVMLPMEGVRQPCARSDRRLGLSDIHRTLLGLVAPMKYP